MIPQEEIIREKDINIHFDSFFSQINFDNNFVSLKDGTYLYIDEGNLSKEIDNSILPKQKGKLLDCIFSEFPDSYDKKTLLAQNQDTLAEWLQNLFYDNEDFLETCSNYDIKTAKDNYIEINIRGYSQGDSAIVLVNKVEALDVWGGKDINEESLKTLFTNYFYDSVLLVRLNILGTEYISEQFDFQYQNGDNDYDKDELIKELITYFQTEVSDINFFKEQLEELLPITPSYK
jgi:hypothetical protein